MSHLFRDRDNTYSWRKILTAIAAVIFSFASVGYLFGLPELTTGYQAIIAGVFAFYFFKDVARNVKITNETTG
jgi:hypothetical protein